MLSNKEIVLFHYDSSITTIQDLFEKEKIVGIKPKEFLELNKQAIFNSLNSQDKGTSITSPDQLNVNCYLRAPIKLKLPVKNATKEIISSNTNLQDDASDFNAFLGEQIDKIINNPSYLSLGKGVIVDRNKPQVTVWLWSKSLMDNGVGSLFDLSPYVNNLQVSTTETGGNFSFTLPPIKGKKVPINGGFYWDIDYDSISFYDFNRQNNWVSRTSFNSRKPTSAQVQINNNEAEHEQASILKRTDFAFQKIIASNDIIFISLDSLKKTDNESKLQQDITPSSIDLPNNIFDMIALVDLSTVNYNAGSNVVTIDVNGRDLMKLLIDDGSYFFNSSIASEDVSGMFKNMSENQGDVRDVDYGNDKRIRPFERMRLPAGEVDIFLRYDYSIEYVLKGLFSQLSNIQVAPDELFSAYGENRTSFQTGK